MPPAPSSDDQPLILVADDEPSARMLACEALRLSGFRVAEAKDGAEALELFADECPAMVLLDVMMPKLDGFEVCAELRKQSVGGHVPIVIVTGLDDVESIQNAYDLGATSFMTKPINWPLLEHHVRYILRASRNEHELRKARETADLASRSKSEFLATMSHELRTPLHAIIGFSELIAGAPKTADIEKCADYGADISSSGRHLLAIIDDILDIAKIDAGQVEIRQKTADLEHLLQSCVGLLDAKAGSAKLSLKTELPPNLGLIVTDTRKLKQIVVNLLSNAVKFTPTGGRITLGAMREKGGFRITVRDNGIGISPENRERVFHPFFQVDGKLDRKFDGTGIGLAIARSYAEALGGKIEIESKEGSGTQVTLTIPDNLPADFRNERIESAA